MGDTGKVRKGRWGRAGERRAERLPSATGSEQGLQIIQSAKSLQLQKSPSRPRGAQRARLLSRVHTREQREADPAPVGGDFLHILEGVSFLLECGHEAGRPVRGRQHPLWPLQRSQVRQSDPA